MSDLSFNDTDNFAPVQNFTISNTSKKPVTYALSHIGAPSGYTFANETCPSTWTRSPTICSSGSPRSVHAEGKFTIAGRPKVRLRDRVAADNAQS